MKVAAGPGLLAPEPSTTFDQPEKLNFHLKLPVKFDRCFPLFA